MATFSWQFSKDVPPATSQQNPDGSTWIHPGMVDVTAEINQSAVNQGVVLDPAKLLCDYGAENVPMTSGTCEDGSLPAPGAMGRHYSWTAWSDKPRAGFSSMVGCGSPKYMVCNMVVGQVTHVSGTVIQL